MDGSTLPSFITWTGSNNTLYVATHNDHAGTYNIKISCQDDFNGAVISTFDVEVIYNHPPVVNSQVEDMKALVFTFF